MPEDYPVKLVGEFDRGSVSKAELTKGAMFDKASPPLVRFEAELADIQRYDVLVSDLGAPIVNDRVAEFLISHAGKDIQLLPVEVACSDGVAEDWRVVNVLSVVSALDKEKSSFFLVPGATDTIMGFDRVVYDTDGLGRHMIAREREYLPHVLVSDVLASEMSAARYHGVALIDPAEIR